MFKLIHIFIKRGRYQKVFSISSFPLPTCISNQLSKLYYVTEKRLRSLSENSYQRIKNEDKRKGKPKESHIRTNIGAHDLNFKLKQMLQWIEKGYNLQVTVEGENPDTLLEDLKRHLVSTSSINIVKKGTKTLLTAVPKANV